MIKVGDKIKVTSGEFENCSGMVKSISKDNILLIIGDNWRNNKNPYQFKVNLEDVEKIATYW